MAQTKQDGVALLVGRQLRLFERAHAEALELKPLGYAFRKAGLDLTKLYANPRFMMLPFEECPFLSGLSSTQMSRLSAAYYGALYSDAARHETRVIPFNMQVAERVFPRYSDDYMVLFSESDEEFDHVLTFRSVCQTSLAPADGRWRGVQPPEGQLSNAPAYQGLDAAFERLGDRLCGPGYGALYLLHRFLLNIMLKQTESFMHKNLSSGPHTEGDYHPLALQITRAHETDEARHFITSLELGLGLLAQATSDARRRIQSVLSMFTASLVSERFGVQPATEHFERAQVALEVALSSPEFAGFGKTAPQLRALWQEQRIPIPEREEYNNSRRWMAREIKRLIERAELRIPASEAFERLEDLAKAA